MDGWIGGDMDYGLMVGCIGHNGWVTSIVTSPEAPDMVISASRGNSRRR